MASATSAEAGQLFPTLEYAHCIDCDGDVYRVGDGPWLHDEGDSIHSSVPYGHQARPR